VKTRFISFTKEIKWAFYYFCRVYHQEDQYYVDKDIPTRSLMIVKMKEDDPSVIDMADSATRDHHINKSSDPTKNFCSSASEVLVERRVPQENIRSYVKFNRRNKFVRKLLSVQGKSKAKQRGRTIKKSGKVRFESFPAWEEAFLEAFNEEIHRGMTWLLREMFNDDNEVDDDNAVAQMQPQPQPQPRPIAVAQMQPQPRPMEAATRPHAQPAPEAFQASHTHNGRQIMLVLEKKGGWKVIRYDDGVEKTLRVKKADLIPI